MGEWLEEKREDINPRRFPTWRFLLISVKSKREVTAGIDPARIFSYMEEQHGKSGRTVLRRVTFRGSALSTSPNFPPGDSPPMRRCIPRSLWARGNSSAAPPMVSRSFAMNPRASGARASIRAR